MIQNNWNYIHAYITRKNKFHINKGPVNLKENPMYGPFISVSPVVKIYRHHGHKLFLDFLQINYQICQNWRLGIIIVEMC